MTAVLLDHPWVLLGLLYVVGWLIVCVCARRRGSPPQPDVPPVPRRRERRERGPRNDVAFPP